MGTTSIERYHDICAGHRVVGHEGKCRHLHGHNYRIYFTCEAFELDTLGRVVDFTVVKNTLCEWLEENWDHKFLAWEKDNLINRLADVMETDRCEADLHGAEDCEADFFFDGLVRVPFNPTAEALAKHLVEVVGPEVLVGTGVTLTKCRVEETRKCGATYEI